AALPAPDNATLEHLLDPNHTDSALDKLGPAGAFFDPILHNTVNATLVHGGDKFNVIPSKIVLQLDGRLLPGYAPDDMMDELHRLLGADLELTLVPEIPRGVGSPEAPDMGLFDTLAGILREADPDGLPLPLLMAGVTDGRWFARLGIQTYGFLPMPLPPDFNAMQVIH